MMKAYRTFIGVVMIVAALAAPSILELPPAYADNSFRFDISTGNSTKRAPGGLSPQSGEGGTIEFGSWNPGQLTDADVSTPAVFDAFPNVFKNGFFSGLVITSFSARGLTWFMKVRLLAPLSSGANTIPITTLSLKDPDGRAGGTMRWFGFAVAPEATGVFTNSNNGTYVDSAGVTQPYSYLTATDFTCYTSGPGEADGSRVSKSHYGFFILVPPDQRPGAYSGEVQFTMTE